MKALLIKSAPSEYWIEIGVRQIRVESKESSIVGSAAGSLLQLLAEKGVLNQLPTREKAVIRLQKKVEIEAFEKSNVLTVSFKSHSPELAQEVVDRLVSEYQTQHVNLHRPPRAFEFLETETNRIESELDEARAKLEAFKNRTGILESTQQRTVLIERIAQLKADLLLSEATEAALRTEVNELTQRLALLPETETMAQTVGAGNDGADGMRQELYRLEVMREQLDAKFRSNHPRMKQMNDQVKKAMAILSEAEADRRESIIGPNKIYQETAVAIGQKRPMLAAEQARAEILRKQINSIEATLDQFTANEREFAKLDRKVEILEGNFRKYATNLEQARIDTKMKSQEFSNVGIAQPATLNLKPTSPNKMVNLCAAIFLGMFGGIGLAVFSEYLNPSVSDEEDVEQSIGSPVIMMIPELESSQLVAMAPKRPDSLLAYEKVGDSAGSETETVSPPEEPTSLE